MVGSLLTQLGLSDKATRPISDLSGGEQQRAFLARALAQEPAVVLMDEPFAGVDAPTQETILGLLDELKRAGVAVMVSTHDLALAAGRFDHVLLLNGWVIAAGPPEEVMRPELLTAAFGAQALLGADGRPYFAVTNESCSVEPAFPQQPAEGALKR